MEELNKKIIGNAVAAYFMVLVSIFFLFSKETNINHPFVKSHVKSAFVLHILMLIMLYIMSFPFLGGVDILGYSLNTLITAGLGLGIFSAILYATHQAHNGKTITIGEIFHRAGVSKNLMSTSRSEEISEQESTLLILAHIPFIGYIIYPRHKNLVHIKDISKLNLAVTLIASLLYIAAYTSLANVIMLAYIIWSVFQSVRLITQGEIITLDLSWMPTVGEKHIIQRSLITYIKNSIHKDAFTDLKTLMSALSRKDLEKEKQNLEILKTKKAASIPSYIFYIPVLNIIGLFFLKTRDSFHIKNGLIITILLILIYVLFGWDSPSLTLLLFPIFYGIGYIDRKGYKMPYIYDIYALCASICSHIGNLFHKTRTLQKTDTKVVTKMGEEKK